MERSAPVQRTSALSRAARAHSECARAAMTQERTERETDERRLEQRRKQVEKGQQTAECVSGPPVSGWSPVYCPSANAVQFILPLVHPGWLFTLRQLTRAASVFTHVRPLCRSRYMRFRTLVPKGSRSHVRLLHPTEPDPTEKMSSRLWNLRLKTWRRALHDYESGVELSAPYVSARWVHTVQKTADKIPAPRLQECGEALERRARELSPAAAFAALGPPDSSVTRWSRARVQKAFQLLDQLDGAKGKGLMASASKPESRTGLYELPAKLSIRVVSTAQEVSDALPVLMAACAACPVLGLDTEWVASSDRCDETDGRVVLLQLSTESYCLLVRLGALDAVPDCLTELLADTQVLKCGVSIAHDVELLHAQYAVAVRGAVDLAALAHICGSEDGYKYTKDGLGLNAIIQSTLGYHLAKDVFVRCGDWSAELTAQQIYYAACDAHAAQRALLKLHRNCIGAKTTVPVLGWCYGHAIVDRPVGRADRALMRSQAEEAQGAADASERRAGGELPEQPDALKASIPASPPSSAVRSPNERDSDGARRADADQPAQSSNAEQATLVVKPSSCADAKNKTFASVAANGSDGDIAALLRSSAPSPSDAMRPKPVATSASTNPSRWGSPEEVRRQLF